MDEDKKVNKRSDIEANMEGISKSIQILMEGCRNIAKAHIIENVSTVVSGISKILSTIEVSAYMKSFKESFSTFFNALEEARKIHIVILILWIMKRN